jgi:hypothetical protein
MARMEAQLQEALKGSQLAQEPQTRTLAEVDNNLGFTQDILDEFVVPDMPIDLADTQDMVDFASSHVQYNLPPMEVVAPFVDDYFLYFNPIIPLFDQASFLAMLRDWYCPQSERSPAEWAAINIAIALAYRSSLKPSGTVEANRECEELSHCLRNAQSVVSDLVSREKDLLGLQVLLGMIILYQGAKEPKPASILIGTAVRLAHRLRLASQDKLQYFNPEVALQRQRIFWLTYYLDKVCM